MRIAHLIALPLLACLLRPIRADQIVIPLEVDSGDRQGRDNRVFTVPIEVGAVSTRFVWGCGGETIITQRVAEAARLQVKPSRELDVYTDAEGRPLFLGEAAANLHFGGRLHQITAWIMRESEYTRGMAGTIGYEVARRSSGNWTPRCPR